ncbi:MAG: hypothetical protein H8E44_19465 [Planctomycetes bacterium]|nr:hypothetical protein [Planctomycetota bacterium]MBL7037019.1 hypothetical protein [Pirellulaceae bacterium]
MSVSRISWLALTIVLITLQSTAQAKDRVEWWSANGDLSARLLSGEVNLVDRAVEFLTAEPKTAREATEKVNIFLRAGLYAEACDAVDELWQFDPEIDRSVIDNLYYRARKDGAWDFALVLVETFAPRIVNISLDEQLFIEHGSESEPKPWSPQRKLDWIDAKIEKVIAYEQERAKTAEPNDRAEQFRGYFQSGASVFWWRQRLCQLARMDLHEAELDRLAGFVRARPTDTQATMNYLSAIGHLDNQGRYSLKPNQLDWMGEVFRPPLATDMRNIAEMLMDKHQPKAAEPLLRRAIDSPLGAQDIERVSWMYAARLSEERHRQLFAVDVREKLAQCLLALNQADRAQEIMIEAADMREKHNLPLNAHLAGTVQMASGAQVIEGRIRQREPLDENSPKYWRERAQYYRGRNETTEEETALRRGVELCEDRFNETDRPTLNEHYWLYSDLTAFLIRNHREQEAVRLTLDVIDKYAKSYPRLAEGAVGQMTGRHLSKHLRADEEILWRWLEAQDVWDYHEERLLRRILGQTTGMPKGKYITRAERLAMADGVDASAASTLGWIVNRMDMPARSVPLLRHAIKQATKDDLMEETSFTLFESYLDLKDWRQAEAIFPVAERRLAPSEDPSWLGRIATIAAEKGDTADAMRLFRRVINLRLTNRRIIEDVSELGLKKEIRVYYATVRKRLPTAKLDHVFD